MSSFYNMEYVFNWSPNPITPDQYMQMAYIRLLTKAYIGSNGGVSGTFRKHLRDFPSLQNVEKMEQIRHFLGHMIYKHPRIWEKFLKESMEWVP